MPVLLKGKSEKNGVVRAPSIVDLRGVAACGTGPSVLRVNRNACATKLREAADPDAFGGGFA